MLIQTSFFVPLTDDRTRDIHSYLKFEQLERQLFIKFGGWSYEGIIKGVYKDPDTGEPVQDYSRKYCIALEQKDIPKLRRYLKKIKKEFGQKKLYFEVRGKVEFL